jgi:nicotinamidase-related amidase
MTEASTLGPRIPPPPAPVPVTLDPSTSALVVMDLTESICTPQPNCRDMVPRIAALLGRARAAGLHVAYTSGGAGGSPVPEVAPVADDPVVQGMQNKFFNTNLHDVLRLWGIRTVILSGWRANGSVLYTSHGATNLGYTVVVPIDGTAAPEEFQVAISFYQVLNLINANPTNEPLKPGAVTLSRTDLISFG